MNTCRSTALDFPEQLPWLRPLPSRSLSLRQVMQHPPPLQSQGALAGRLRSFSMQDLRSIPDNQAPAYQDPLYMEDQMPRHRPPIGEWAEGHRAVLRGLASST